MLAGAEEIACATEFEVFFGEDEAIGGGFHGFHAFGGNLAIGLIEEDAIGLPLATADTSTELVELGEPEAFGVFDDHYAGIGHVYADFDDGGGDEDIGIAVDEIFHYFGFLGGFKFAVHEGDGEVRGEGLAEGFDIGGGGFGIDIFAFVDEGADDIDLAAFGDLFADKGIYAGAIAFVDMECFDLLAARGEFVHDGDIEVAVEDEGEGAGDWSGCHD